MMKFIRHEGRYDMQWHRGGKKETTHCRDLERVFNVVVGVDIAEHCAPDERDDETQLRQRHHEHLQLHLRSTFRVHRHVAHVHADYVEEDCERRQPHEHRHDVVAVVSFDQRRVRADGRRQRANDE